MSLDFFNNSIKDADPEVYETLEKELERDRGPERKAPGKTARGIR